jgi:hypothetical protein
MKPTSQLERLASHVVVLCADLCDALSGLDLLNASTARQPGDSQGAKGAGRARPLSP